MIRIFRKIWDFSGDEKNNIRKSIVIGFLNSIFNAFQLSAIYVVLKSLSGKTNYKNIIWYSLGLMAISIMGKIITQYFSQLQMTHAGYFMSGNKRISIGEKLKKVPMGFFNDNSLGELTAITTNILNELENTVPVVLVIVLGGFLNTLVFTVAIYIFDYRIGIIATLGIVFFIAVTSIMERKSKSNAKRRQKSQSYLVKNILENIQGMLVIKSYNLNGEKNKKVTEAIDENCNANLKMEKSMVPYITCQNIVLNIVIVTMIFSSLKFYFNETMTLVNAVMMIISSFMIFENLRSAGSSMAILRVAENSIEKVNEVNLIPVMSEGKFDTEISNYNIEFNNVNFSYENKKIINNITVKFPENNITAIIGPSGGGKTTICNLIARFWDVDSGEIKIGGKNIKDFALGNLMSNISIVFQNVYLFEDTIENNIKFGKPNASHEEVVDVAKKACCHEFIINLPSGYDTIIGEGGATISGGEKQRLSIARAILKDAPIIIFDEATANIDPENENKLQMAIESLTKDKTIIMIAHRLKTIRNADQILVLEDGRIVQKGNHEELINQIGIYKDFIEIKDRQSNWKIKN